MDIKSEIIKADLNAKRNKQKLKKVILGRKEKELLHEQIGFSEDLQEKDNTWRLAVEYVDEDSHFETICWGKD